MSNISGDGLERGADSTGVLAREAGSNPVRPSLFLDRIIGHLGAAAVQRAWIDDAIISDHIDAALAAAKALKAELAKQKETQS